MIDKRINLVCFCLPLETYRYLYTQLQCIFDTKIFEHWKHAVSKNKKCTMTLSTRLSSSNYQSKHAL
jgi:hypothetical protein